MHPSETSPTASIPPTAPPTVEDAAPTGPSPARSPAPGRVTTGDPSDRPDGVTRVVCAIPARWASTRLPGKPLREIAGRPMIRHVVERVRSARGIDRIVVLTDDRRIAEAVEAFGGEAEMTPESCASGTDRIAWAARHWTTGSGDADLAVINVQGDEPLIEPTVVERVAKHLRDHPEDGMVTLSAPLAVESRTDPSRVKVVTDLQGYALYFSRAAIPHHRDEGSADAVQPRLHVGLYGYRLGVLERLAALAPSPLERTESLEQLRALEHGIRIRVLPCEHGAFGVDTEDDLSRAARLLGDG